mmetsp:Transcript_36192/g.90308  ORF Transcript_36192/g.90308 Transcript_36192/m.90308 type:complete len:223 (-) Transcript_36192:1651-2319(-)
MAVWCERRGEVQLPVQHDEEHHQQQKDHQKQHKPFSCVSSLQPSCVVDLLHCIGRAVGHCAHLSLDVVNGVTLNVDMVRQLLVERVDTLNVLLDLLDARLSLPHNLLLDVLGAPITQKAPTLEGFVLFALREGRPPVERWRRAGHTTDSSSGGASRGGVEHRGGEGVGRRLIRPTTTTTNSSTSDAGLVWATAVDDGRAAPCGLAAAAVEGVGRCGWRGGQP